MYPRAQTSLDKLTEDLTKEHRSLLEARQELIAELETTHPEAVQLMVDCLRFKAADR